MQRSNVNEYDVVVLGGGPGGSTAATLIAMRGHRVLLLERDHFPRHQVGESLLPATVHGICRLLGLTDELKRHNFPIKRGGTLVWGRRPEPWTFAFSSDPRSPTGTAYQVERMKFDAILLSNARARGVDVREGHTFVDLVSDGGRVVGARYTDANGLEGLVSAKYVVDATGNSGHCHRYCGERVFSRFFQNVALYGYYENGHRLDPPNGGNILCVAFAQGWFWYIPLSATLTSVGAVVARDAAVEIQEGCDRAMEAFIERAPMIKTFLATARRVTSGPYGQLRVRKDYSYCNTLFWKPGLALVGDAACFVDPILSSGVHLSTYSALLAARSINTVLEERGIPEATCFGEFERRYRREYGNFYQFLVGFYDMHVDEESYFWRARKLLGTAEADNTAFVRLVSGLAAQEEPAFAGARQFFDQRAGFGSWLENRLQSGAGMQAAEPTLGKSSIEFDPAQFMAGFTSEIASLQMLALFGDKRPQDTPLFDDRLIPDPDGLGWQRATEVGDQGR